MKRISKTIDSSRKSALRFRLLIGLSLILGGVTLLYFSGCEGGKFIGTTPQMDAAEQFWIRVLLGNKLSECRIKTPGPFRVVDPTTGQPLASFGKKYRNVTLPVKTTSTGLLIADQSIPSKNIELRPEKPYVFSINGNRYRGKLALISQDDKTFDAINIVPLEAYLAGVVGSEMPDFWEPEALKAQAVAARTYCLFIKKDFGSKRHWDLNKTAAHQVYRGIAAESKPIWNAINQTAGQILLCPQKTQTGSEYLIFPTYYSSTCGGHTENSKNVFGDSYSALQGVSCPYCKDIAKPAYFLWPMAQFPKQEVSDKLIGRYASLKKLEYIENIKPIATSTYPGLTRMTKVQLQGKNGKTDWIRGEDLRLSIDPSGSKLRSTACQIITLGNNWAFVSGRGYGHGVGMCQCGAQGMARQGKTAYEILQHYYPTSVLTRVY